MRTFIFLFISLLFIFESCSCEYHARKAGPCLVKFQDSISIPVEIEIVRDSVCVDSLLNIVNDTFKVCIDSINIIGIIQPGGKAVEIQADRKAQKDTIYIPVKIAQPELVVSWSNWWMMTKRIWTDSLRGWVILAFIFSLIILLIKYFKR